MARIPHARRSGQAFVRPRTRGARAVPRYLVRISECFCACLKKMTQILRRAIGTRSLDLQSAFSCSLPDLANRVRGLVLRLVIRARLHLGEETDSHQLHAGEDQHDTEQEQW